MFQGKLRSFLVVRGLDIAFMLQGLVVLGASKGHVSLHHYPLLRPHDPDDRFARHDEHLAPAPLVVHQVGVDGSVPRLRGPDVAVVLERSFPHAGREDLVVLDRPHQTTPTCLSCFLPSGVISFLDQVSQTTSMSTSSTLSISRSRSHTSSWIMS